MPNKKQCPLCTNVGCGSSLQRWGLEMLCPAAAHKPGPAPAPTELREVTVAVSSGSDQRQRPLVTLTPCGQMLIRASPQP
jgi:hypothetical protein